MSKPSGSETKVETDLSYSGSPAAILPKNITKTIMTTLKRDTPKICLQTVGERMATLSVYGGPSMTDLRGGSVARARAAKMSMIKLIHKSWTEVNGYWLNKRIPMKRTTKQEMLTVTWNCKNLVML